MSTSNKRVPYYTLEELVADLSAILKNDETVTTSLMFDNYYTISFNDGTGKSGYAKLDDFDLVTLRKGDTCPVKDLIESLQPALKKNPKGGVGFVDKGVLQNVGKVKITSIAVHTISETFFYKTLLNPNVPLGEFVENLNEKKADYTEFVKLHKETFNDKAPTNTYFLVGETWYGSEKDLFAAFPRLSKQTDWKDLFSIIDKESFDEKYTVYRCSYLPNKMTEQFGPKPKKDKSKIKAFMESCPLLEDGRIITTTIESDGTKMITRTLPDGKLDGLQESFYSSGKGPGPFPKHSTMMKNGLREGQCLEWDTDGRLTRRCSYTNDKPDGLYETWKDGKITYKCVYKNGDYNGILERFIDGRIVYSCEYKMDVPDGFETIYDPDGKITKQITYVDGKLTKTVTNPDGANLVATENPSQFLVDGTKFVVEKISTGSKVLVGIKGSAKTLDKPTPEEIAEAKKLGLITFE